MENNYSVYQHVTPDNMYYFGATQNVEQRWEGNGCHYKRTALQPYIEKYGWDNIQHIVLFKDQSKENALWIENFLIETAREDGVCINKNRSGLVSKEEGYKQEYYETNKEQILEQHKQYREENKEQILEQKKQYYEENKEQIKERKKQYYEQNKDKKLEYQQQYREQNKEQIREYQQQYREQNKDKIREQKKKYREQNKEQIREQKKQYYEQNKDKKREYNRQYYQRKKLEKQLKEVETTLF